MKNLLEEIVAVKKREIEADKNRKPIADFIDSKRLTRSKRPFKEAISASGINLIAEIKKKSPASNKNFFKKLEPRNLAAVYKAAGAKAISVLTDKKYFGGSILHLNEVRKVVELPILRKDFIIDEYQIYESCYFGADAVLLIARILSVEQLKSFIYLSYKIGMDVIVEVHDESDIEKACLADAKIIGINNRDLDTLEISLDTTIRLALKIPKEIIKISESGINSPDDIERLKKIGINAVLIGTAFLESEDISAKINQIMGQNAG
jgi:indole-3-glycerol phosphate synthase